MPDNYGLDVEKVESSQPKILMLERDFYADNPYADVIVDFWYRVMDNARKHKLGIFSDDVVMDSDGNFINTKTGVRY